MTTKIATELMTMTEAISKSRKEQDREAEDRRLREVARLAEEKRASQQYAEWFHKALASQHGITLDRGTVTFKGEIVTIRYDVEHFIEAALFLKNLERGNLHTAWVAGWVAHFPSSGEPTSSNFDNLISACAYLLGRMGLA